MENRALEKIQDSLMESFDSLSDILKSLFNATRFKILILLLVNSQDFGQLLKETGIKKSALANHLKILQDALLVEKLQHGKYSITPDGKNYLIAINKAFKDSYFSRMRLRSVQSFLERQREI